MAPRKYQEAGQCWKKLVTSNTPDCGAILNLCHFSPNILTQHPVSSHTSCLCARAAPAPTSFCSSDLPSSFPAQGLWTCYSVHLKCLPSPIPHVHDWFVCSQVSVKHHFCLSHWKQPSASHPALVSSPCFSVFIR